MMFREKEKKRKRSISGEIRRKEKFATSTPLLSKGTPATALQNATPSTTSNAAQTSLDSSKVKSGVKAVFKLIEDHASKGTSLFPDEACPIHMQITCVKVARTPERQIRFLLPHSLVMDTSDVCLFVADLKKGKKEDHEPTVAHYRDLLERNGVTGITQIIPVRQLKVEYDQYEMKRRLCDQFDYFLSDARVSGHIRHLLGKHFVMKRKYPTPVKLDAKNLKNEITRALSKTVLNLQGKGNCTTVKVGHNKQLAEQITENVLALAEGLAREYPGGWDNIRSLNLKAPKTLPIPIYLTLKSSNMVDVPRVMPKRPKAAQPVEDELSTFLGARIKVLPSGKVIVTKDGNEEEDSDTELNEIIDEYSSTSKSKKRKKKNRNKQNKQENLIPSRTHPQVSSIGTEDSMSDDGKMEISSAEEDGVVPAVQVKKKNRSHGIQDIELHVKSGKNKKIKKARVLEVSKESENDDQDDGEKDIEDAETAYLSWINHQQESSTEESKRQPSGEPQAKKKKRKKNKKVFKADDDFERKKQEHIKDDDKGKSKRLKKIKEKNSVNTELKIKNKKQKLKHIGIKLQKKNLQR